MTEAELEKRVRHAEQNLVELKSDCKNKHESQQRQIDKIQKQVDGHELSLDGSYDHPGLIERVGANDAFRKKWVGIFASIFATVVGGVALYFLNQ